MTGPIRGPNGLPLDAVPPIQPIPRIASPQNEQRPPEQPDAENAARIAKEEARARQQFLDSLRQTIKDDGNQRGEFNHWT